MRHLPRPWTAGTRVLLSVICIAGVTDAAAPPAVARGTGTCGRPGSQLVAANGLLRVLSRAGEVIACARTTGHETLLGNTRAATACFPDACWIDHVRVAGRFVAYAEQNADREGDTQVITLVDGVNGRRLHSTPNGTCTWAW